MDKPVISVYNFVEKELYPDFLLTDSVEKENLDKKSTLYESNFLDRN